MNVAHGWRGRSKGVGGTITVVETRGLDDPGGLVCRRFVESITIADKRATVRDAACWVRGWHWLRRKPGSRVADGPRKHGGQTGAA